MLFTADDESALLLKSVFLSGQQKEVATERQQAFNKGVINALNTIGFFGEY